MKPRAQSKCQLEVYSSERKGLQYREGSPQKKTFHNPHDLILMEISNPVNIKLVGFSIYTYIICILEPSMFQGVSCLLI